MSGSALLTYDEEPTPYSEIAATAAAELLLPPSYSTEHYGAFGGDSRSNRVNH
jgi:hypothetical protein